MSTAHTVALPESRDPDEHPHPFANGAWSSFIAAPHPEPTPEQLSEADEHDGRRRAHYQAREESFRRSDTDGFISQWASDLNGQEHGRQASILRQGGCDLFPGLFDRETGERVRAKLIEGKLGWCWAFCDERGEFTGKFIGDARTKRAKLYKAGYVVLGEYAPARAELVGSGTGLSGTAWIISKRLDGGYPGCPREDG